ncbi:hypothetical protein ACJJTC_014859 [Scirpophaga incertulas]
MNILPKKRWHVRTKDNIARVRKDEAEAAEKQRQEKNRIENADREARLNILKNKSKEKLQALGIEGEKKEHIPNETSKSSHINFFTDIDHAVKNTNKQYEKEKKEKLEDYEKKIGYLTYLGQDTNEALKKKNWYEVAPTSRFSESNKVKDTYEKLVFKDQDGKPVHKKEEFHNGERDWKLKQRHDPIKKFIKYCKHKTESKSTAAKLKNVMSIKMKDKKVKEGNLEKLRAARLKREQQEKYRTEMFLSNLHNPSTTTPKTLATSSKIEPKYNSQYNPEFARQNYK